MVSTLNIHKVPKSKLSVTFKLSTSEAIVNSYDGREKTRMDEDAPDATLGNGGDTTFLLTV